MPDIDRRLVAAAVVLLILGFFGGMKYNDFRWQQQAKKQALIDSARQDQTETAKQPEAKTIEVYVTGAVKTPGVYTLKEGDRVYQAVDMAGGPLAEAQLKNVNMAARLQDSEQVWVPLTGEEAATGGNTLTNPTSEAGPQGKININTATNSQLESLNGIGPALAQRVVEYRQAHGSFKKIDDIKNVSGIGEKKFQAIKEKICVN